jgi:hypothetical protein
VKQLAVISSVVAATIVLVATLNSWSAHAQAISIVGSDWPPLVRGTCFATTAAQDRHLRVEEIRSGWIRVAIAADKNQTNTLVRIESRWMNAVYAQEIVTISGPKACDFLD